MKHVLRNPAVMFFVALQAFIVLGILSSLLASRLNSDSLLQGNTVIREHTEEILSLVVNNTRNHTKVLLEPAENSVLLSHSLLQDSQIDASDNQALKSYFLKQLQTNQQFSGMYFGRPDGSFLFVRRENQVSSNTNQTNSQPLKDVAYRTKIIELSPTRSVKNIYLNKQGIVQFSEMDNADRYDPRIRSWYQEANERSLNSSNKAIWTDPYIFFDSQKPGITTAKTVIQKDGTNIGTVGIDIQLTDLSQYLETITLRENKSFPFIKTVDNVVIAFPQLDTYLTDNQTQTLPHIDDIGNDISKDFLKQNNSFGLDKIVDFKVDDTDYIGTLQPIRVIDQQRWLLGIYAPKEVYAGNIQNRYQENLLRILVIGLLFSCLAIPISLSVARPLKHLQKQATTDPLTGLLNRSAFDNQANFLKSEAERLDLHVAYVMLDLDNFKPVNDVYGHATGDEVLTIVAKRLQECVKEQDVIGRYGGDEFAICLYDVTSKNIFEVVERIRNTIENPQMITSSGTHTINTTVGAVLSEKNISHSQLMNLADNSLILGKTIVKGKSYIDSVKLENLNSDKSPSSSKKQASVKVT